MCLLYYEWWISFLSSFFLWFFRIRINCNYSSIELGCEKTVQLVRHIHYFPEKPLCSVGKMKEIKKKIIDIKGRSRVYSWNNKEFQIGPWDNLSAICINQLYNLGSFLKKLSSFEYVLSSFSKTFARKILPRNPDKKYHKRSFSQRNRWNMCIPRKSESSEGKRTKKQRRNNGYCCME